MKSVLTDIPRTPLLQLSLQRNWLAQNKEFNKNRDTGPVHDKDQMRRPLFLREQ